MYDADTLQATLKGYCKWQTVPRQLFLNAINSWARNNKLDVSAVSANDEELQEKFLHALGLTVSLEWTVCQHNTFTASDSSVQNDQGRSKQQTQPQPQQLRQQATIYAQAVGTPYGLMCFGGMELGKLQQIRVKSEVSWMKESNGTMLQPDLSRVYQVPAIFQPPRCQRLQAQAALHTYKIIVNSGRCMLKQEPTAGA